MAPLTTGGAAARKPASDATYRVMVVDDSAVIRGFMMRALSQDPEIEVVATAANGQIALKEIERTEVDVVILDIEMPVMDGLTALPRLLRARPGVKVIVASTLTRHNAAISMTALASGASDYIPKPTSSRELHTTADFQRELIEKIKALAGRDRARPQAVKPAAKSGGQGWQINKPSSVVLRKPSPIVPEVLAIGSSTGGPQALFKLFGTLKTQIKTPIFITQHMPPTFTSILAEHLARASGAPCSEAKDNETPVPGHIYIAPGDYHMTVVREGTARRIRLNQDPPENFCRPAVDPMLRSLVKAYGPKVLAVILTGMGHDGLEGGRAVVEAGGTLIAQDERTSVVWGMPGAVASAGLASAMLPIEQIGNKVLQFFGGARR